MKKQSISIVGLSASLLISSCNYSLASDLFPSLLPLIACSAKRSPIAQGVALALRKASALIIPDAPSFLGSELDHSKIARVTTSAQPKNDPLHPNRSWGPLSEPTYEAVNIPGIIDAAKKNSGGPVQVNISLNNHHTQTATVQEKVPVKESPEPSFYSKTMLTSTPWHLNIRASSEKFLSSLKQWVMNHKLFTLGGCAALTYGVIQIGLATTEWRLLKETNWSGWKKQCTLDDLYRLKQTDLMRDLINAVEGPQRKAPDTIKSLTNCVTEIDKELAALSRYRSLVGLVDRRFFNKIFFYNTHLLDESQDRIQRLRFLRSTAYAAVTELKKQQSSQATA